MSFPKRTYVDADRGEVSDDLIWQTLQANMKPLRGESFEDYNNRLNQARIQASLQIAHARQKGVKIDRNYAENCITTAMANFQDPQFVGKNYDPKEDNRDETWYDPNGLYQAFHKFNNAEFQRNPALQGFKYIEAFYPNGVLFPKEGAEDENDVYTTNETHPKQSNLGDLVSYAKAANFYTKYRPDGSEYNVEAPWHWSPYHAVTIGAYDPNGTAQAYYSPGGVEGEYHKGVRRPFFRSDGDAIYGHQGKVYRYVGTPEELKARKIYYDAASRQYDWEDMDKNRQKNDIIRMSEIFSTSDVTPSELKAMPKQQPKLVKRPWFRQR